MYGKYKNRFAFRCPPGSGSPYSVIYTSVHGTMALAWSCCSGVVLAASERVLCSLEDSF